MKQRQWIVAVDEQNLRDAVFDGFYRFTKLSFPPSPLEISQHLWGGRRVFLTL